MTESCANCFFFFNSNTCCFGAPRRTSIAQAGATFWPVVKPSDWCGDWSADGLPRYKANQVSNSVLSTISFGAAWAQEASVVVLNQPGIASGASIQAWLQGDYTVDNSAANHLAAAQFVGITAGSLIPGVGYTLFAHSYDAVLKGTFTIHSLWTN